MSVTGSRALRKLLRQILSDHKSPRGLKGGLLIRTSSINRVSNLLARLNMNRAGRKYLSSKALNDLVASLRETARDTRLRATARVKACYRLAAIEGVVALSELGD